MKKILVCLTAAVMICSLVACGRNGGNTAPSDNAKPEQENVSSETQTEVYDVAGKTPAAVLLEDFKAKVDSGKYTTTEELATAIVGSDITPFDMGVAQVEPGYLNGFTEEIQGFSSGTNVGPYIGTIPFVGYVFQVDQDADAFVQQLKDKADLRWNVCTQADEMVCEAYGDFVFFVMSPDSFDDNGGK